MSPVELLAHPIARQLTLALLHFVWQGLAIAVLLVLAVELLNIRRPQARYACSLAALLVMLACPAVTFWWVSAGENEIVERVSNPSLALFADGLETRPTVDHIADSDWLAAAQPYALAAWLLGVAIFAGRLSAGAIGVLRLRQKLIPLPLDLAANVERLGRRLAIDALPLVFLSRRVTEAMAVGVVRPLVLIPATWATEMPLEMLEAVIAHELAHLRRRDLWVNLLQRVAEAVLFYHPAVWWLSRRLRQERELCADALAVAATGRRLEYAEALEQVARWRQADVGPALAAFMRGGKNMRLLERVRNVLGLGAEGDRSRLWPAGLLILALPLGLWALSLGMASAVADDDRDDDDRPRATREVEDDDDDDREEGRREKEDDDDDDDEKEGRGEKEDDDDDDDEKEGKGEKDDDDGDEKEGKGKDRDEEGDVKKPVRKDGDAPKKEGARDGDAPKKEGARDGDAPKKEGARDGDAPKKEGARDRDAPRKEIRKDEPRKEGDKPIKKEGVRDGEKKIVKEGGGADAAIAELKAMVTKLMAENKELRAELAAARGGKDYIRKEGADIKKEGGDKDPVKKEGAIKKEGSPEAREAAERKEAEFKELRARKERAAAEEKEGAVRKEREFDERALIEKKRAAAAAAAEKDEAAARERLKGAIEKKEADRKDEPK